MAAAFLPLLLLAASLSVTDGVSDSRRDGGRDVQQLWCVAKNNAEDDALRAAIEWACGPGATDCSPIQPGGACYSDVDILSMASFAFNSYYLKSGMAPDSCDFGRSATLTSLNPSRGNCVFQSSTISMNASYTGSSSSTSSIYDMDDASTKFPIWWQLPLSVLLVALTR